MLLISQAPPARQRSSRKSQNRQLTWRERSTGKLVYMFVLRRCHSTPDKVQKAGIGSAWGVLGC